MDTEPALQDFRDLADRFAADRHDRQRRNELDAADFERSRRPASCSPGYPTKAGGLFESVPRSTRAVAEILRVLAQGDSSVALVASMHPAVLSLWLATDEVPESASGGVGRAAGRSWATWPGATGSARSPPSRAAAATCRRSRAVARPGADGGWLLSGQKHFGSGSGHHLVHADDRASRQGRRSPTGSMPTCAARPGTDRAG